LARTPKSMGMIPTSMAGAVASFTPSLRALRVGADMR
jgi:hypothetical protein